ncbi:MAG: hypothetical protein ACOYNN_04165 [Terrimicrobiaceae bacterium]
MSFLATRLEAALCGHLRTILPGFPVYPGHSNEVMESMPRLVCTITSGGGPLMDSGVDELAVEIQILTVAGQTTDEPDPVSTLARISDSIRSAFCLDNLAALKVILNAPASGPDLRPVTGLGLSGLEYTGHKEGRDPERALHGVILTYTAWAHLEA